MKLIIIFGPPAVGKMTVGQELESVTGLKLFHNHMTIELLKPFFDIKSSSFSRLVTLFRTEMLKEMAKSDLEGVIFTGGFDFNDPESVAFMDKISKYFEIEGAQVFYVELETDLEERLKRNKTDNRLNHKPSKRDLVASEAKIIEFDKTCRFNTFEKELKKVNYIKIDNTNINAKKTAQKIKQSFQL